jgi:hypothetical protein
MKPASQPDFPRPRRERNFPVPKPLKKPYIAPRKGARSMTIAAGFRCMDGVVLCADSQITIPGLLKYPESKIRMAEYLQSKPFFTFCGDMDYSKQAINHFSTAIRKAEQNRTDLLSAIETEAANLHLQYYDMYTDPADKLHLDMIVSVLVDKQRHLFKIYGPKVNAVDDFHCIGAGNYLARALTGMYRRPGESVHRTAIVCAYILSEVKKYVDGCGGDSQIICLNDDGSWTLFPDEGMFFSIADIETRFQEWKDQLKELAIHYADFKVSRSEFEFTLSKLTGELLRLRKPSADLYEEVERMKFEELEAEIKRRRAEQVEEP